ncbi:hypothetical protein BZG36_03623 [Bifiguratus adelaidae]|uniref:Uncharacterized protein n=1 Tax=Bifiguratus adelaidae TaxID=1938954 RepID=A0A261Y064_9FUNG|nr:hypothetical protein BZG36_03623 [Bifiguratus adelaidae]
MDKKLIGKAGKDYIRNELSARDPKEVVNELQSKHGLKLRHITDVYPLLDLHKKSRLEVHSACLHALVQAMIDKIDTSEDPSNKYEKLLAETTPYLGVGPLQRIPIALLSKYPDLASDEELRDMVQNADIFDACPMAMKRRIWKADLALFQQHMLTLLNNYHHDEHLQLISRDMRVGGVVAMIRDRRQHPIVEAILDRIGEDTTIYSMFLDFIRLVFDATPYPSVCTLRFDLLMALHEREFKDVYRIDGAHNLAWTLDACIRNQVLDDSRLQNLKDSLSEFQNMKRYSPVYGDVAMILMDPTASNLFSAYILEKLRTFVDKAPRASAMEPVKLVADLINLGANAKNIMENELKKAPKLDTAKHDRFWKIMIGMLADDNKSERRSELSTDQASTINGVLGEEEVCRKVYLQYVLDAATNLDILSLARSLPPILDHFPPLSASVLHTFGYESFFQTFMDIIRRMHLPSLLTKPEVAKVIMEDFLVPATRWSWFVHEHVVQLFIDCFDTRVIGHPGNAGESVRQVGVWAEKTCQTGAKNDEKHMDNLYSLYRALIEQSHNIYDGHVKIAPPGVMDFLRNDDNLEEVEEEAEIMEEG